MTISGGDPRAPLPLYETLARVILKYTIQLSSEVGRVYTNDILRTKPALSLGTLVPRQKKKDQRVEYEGMKSKIWLMEPTALEESCSFRVEQYQF